MASRSRPGSVAFSAAPPILLWGAGLLFLVLPRTSGWSLRHVHKEDGYIFLREWVSDGAASIVTQYTGYLHVVPRLMTGIAAQSPPEWFPVVIGVETASFRLWLGLCLYWVMRATDLPCVWAMAAGAVFVVVPVGQYEVLGNVTNMRWFCDAALVLLVLASLRGWRAWAVAATLFLCALSDPLCLVLSPWLLWRFLRSEGCAGRCVPGAALGGAALHWSLLDSGVRANFVTTWLSHPVELMGQFLVRGWQVAQFGVVGTMAEHRVLGWVLAMLLGLVPLVVVLIARSRRALLLAFLATYLLAASITFASPSVLTVRNWYAIGQPSRYSLAPAIVLTVAGVLACHALRRRGHRWLPILMCAVVLGAVVLDGRGDPQNGQGPAWSTTVENARTVCHAPGTQAAQVEFTPTTPSHQWRTTLPCRWLNR